MTKEEAIKEITRAYDVLDFSCHMDNHRKEAFNMAKVALEQEPCEDAVSRQAVDQNIYDYAESNGLSYANLKNAILDTPSVTPTPKWIPVSEKLPEGNEKVLVCGIEAINNSRVYAVKNWDVDTWRPLSAPSCKWLAWMPLPEPYKEEQ